MKRNIGQEIIKGLEEFTKVLESGEPLENHFRVTTIERVNDFENVVTVKGAGMKDREQTIETLARAIDWLIARADEDESAVIIAYKDWQKFKKAVQKSLNNEAE